MSVIVDKKRQIQTNLSFDFPDFDHKFTLPRSYRIPLKLSLLHSV